MFLDIAYASHNNLIASGSTDGHVRLWDARQQGLLFYIYINRKVYNSCHIMIYEQL